MSVIDDSSAVGAPVALAPKKGSRPSAKLSPASKATEVVRPTREQWDEARRERMKDGFDWPVAIWIAVLHLGALAAPFTFTWQGLALFCVMQWLTGSIGICLGFHRLFTHNGFQTSKPMRYLIACIGQLAGEGSAVHWVANHRKHHAQSDQLGDPHSPLDGPWWSHMGWLMCKFGPENYDKYNKHWAPDMMKDKWLVFLDRTFIWQHIGLAFIFAGIGYYFGGAQLATSLVVWGMFLRLCYVLHVTWFVNSATHMWGYRNYETRDDSRNLWWVGLLAFGEGWHNNHHAYPRMAKHGHKWWEFDQTWVSISILRKLGLIWDVVDSQHLEKHTDNNMAK